MRFYDLNSTQMEGIIKAQFTDESRWTIQPYWNHDLNVPVKAVKIIWKPSTLVFNYLMRKKNEARRCNPLEPPTLFGLRHIGVGAYYDPQNWHYAYRVIHSTTYDVVTHNIILDWYNPQLSCSEVNESIDGLTAQHVHIILKIPYFEGIVRTTHGTTRWQRRPSAQNDRYDNPAYPIWHQFRLNCYISSHKGIYARNKGATYAQRTIVPLYCICSTHNNYHARHHGKYKILLKHNESVHSQYCECMKWRQAIKRIRGYWRINENTNNIEYHPSSQTDWVILYNGTTKEPVKPDDYITAARFYNY